MKFNHFKIKDVLGPKDLEQAKKYIGTDGYFANALESLDGLEFCGVLETVSETSFAYYCKDDTNFKYFLPVEKIKAKYVSKPFKRTLCHYSNDDIKSWATRDDVKVGDVGYFFNNLWDFVEDKVQKGKIYGISKMGADCFFTDENTSFTFFLPEDKVYMI